MILRNGESDQNCDEKMVEIKIEITMIKMTITINKGDDNHNKIKTIIKIIYTIKKAMIKKVIPIKAAMIIIITIKIATIMMIITVEEAMIKIVITKKQR